MTACTNPGNFPGFDRPWLWRPLAIAWLLSALGMFGCAPRPSAVHPRHLAAKPAASSPSAPFDWRSEVPKPGAPAEVQFPTPTVTRLDNGFSVIAALRNSGPAVLRLVVRHGASDVALGHSGLAALVARMMTEGTVNKSSLDLAEAAESLGSTLQDDAQRDAISLELDTLPSDVEAGIELLAEVLREPAFSRREFTRVRKEWLDQLTAARQVPMHAASLVAMRSVLGPALGAPVEGRRSEVRGLTVRDLHRWHRRYVVPEATALLAVGPIDEGRVVSVARRVFGTMAPTDAPTPRPAELPSAPNRTTVYLLDRPGAAQSALFVVQTFPRRADAGYESRRLLSDILGGLFTSRINQNLRERHAYTYGARSNVVATRQFGLFTVTTSVKTNATAAALGQLILELRQVGDARAHRPITEDELGRARSDLIHALGAHLERGSTEADDLQTAFVYELAHDYYAELASKLRLITLSEVDAQVPLLSPSQLSVALVGDRAAVESSLVGAGFTVVAVPETWLD